MSLIHAHVRHAVGVIALVAMVATGCGGSDSADDSSREPNPGAAFTGVYSVTVTDVVRNGKPVETPGANEPFEWIVQSTCDSDGGRCLAVARATAPREDRNLQRDRVELVYDGGEWTRREAYPTYECTSESTGEPLPIGPGVHSTTLRAVALPTENPVQELTGQIDGASDGSCGGTTMSLVDIVRTGDLPADTAPLEDAVPDDVDKAGDVPLHGFYSYEATFASGPIPTEPFRSQLVATPVCARSTDLCVVATPLAGFSVDPVWHYVDGHFELSGVTNVFECPGSPGLQAAAEISMVVEPDGDANPSETLRGTRTLAYQGDCRAVVATDIVITRLAD